MSSELTRRGREFLNFVNDFCGHRAQWLEKMPEDTSGDYGVIPTERPAEEYISYGVVNIDKPPGPTSHEVTAWVKRLLGVKRAGHGGTLGLRPRGLGGEIPK
nr:hypothetical protein [Acidilobus saccharovorans]